MLFGRPGARSTAHYPGGWRVPVGRMGAMIGVPPSRFLLVPIVELSAMLRASYVRGGLPADDLAGDVTQPVAQWALAGTPRELELR